MQGCSRGAVAGYALTTEYADGGEYEIRRTHAKDTGFSDEVASFAGDRSIVHKKSNCGIRLLSH